MPMFMGISIGILGVFLIVLAFMSWGLDFKPLPLILAAGGIFCLYKASVPFQSVEYEVIDVSYVLINEYEYAWIEGDGYIYQIEPKSSFQKYEIGYKFTMRRGDFEEQHKIINKKEIGNKSDGKYSESLKNK